MSNPTPDPVSRYLANRANALLSTGPRGDSGKQRSSLNALRHGLTAASAVPYLVTGLITASGGAWNASVVAEYFHFKGQVLSTFGLGAEISSATDAGNFALLLLSTIVMATLVVSVNRLVWRPLYRRAETRYRLEA